MSEVAARIATMDVPSGATRGRLSEDRFALLAVRRLETSITPRVIERIANELRISMLLP
jgi:hypothetical protein